MWQIFQKIVQVIDKFETQLYNHHLEEQLVLDEHHYKVPEKICQLYLNKPGK